MTLSMQQVEDFNRNWRINWLTRFGTVFKSIDKYLHRHTRTLTINAHKHSFARFHSQFVVGCFICEYRRYFRPIATCFIYLSLWCVHWYTAFSVVVVICELLDFVFPSKFSQRTQNGFLLWSLSFAVNYVRLNIEIRRTRSRMLIWYLELVRATTYTHFNSLFSSFFVSLFEQFAQAKRF